MNDRFLVASHRRGVRRNDCRVFRREPAFDITAASEVMAILCLSDDFEDLKNRLGNIFIGYAFDKKPIYARDLQANGAMAALLKDAIKPNLVQTMEGNPAITSRRTLLPT